MLRLKDGGAVEGGEAPAAAVVLGADGHVGDQVGDGNGALRKLRRLGRQSPLTQRLLRTHGLDGEELCAHILVGHRLCTSNSLMLVRSHKDLCSEWPCNKKRWLHAFLSESQP